MNKNKISLYILTNPFNLLIFTLVYIIFLEITTKVYCDIVSLLINDVEEKNNIVNTVTINKDNSRNIGTKDGGEFTINTPVNTLDIFFSYEKDTADTSY